VDVGRLSQIRYPITEVASWPLPNLVLLGAPALLADRFPPGVARLLITAFLMLARRSGSRRDAGRRPVHVDTLRRQPRARLSKATVNDTRGQDD
jgi:hypothetical protein